VHDISEVDIVVTDRERSPSPLPQLIDAQITAQIDNSEGQTTTTTFVYDDTEVKIAKDQYIQAVQLVQHLVSIKGSQEQEHPTWLELWARIREYDQRIADEGLTQVLTKKQKQTVKTQVLGKSPYRTRARGDLPPSA